MPKVKLVVLQIKMASDGRWQFSRSLCFVLELCQLQASYCSPNDDSKHQLTVICVCHQYNIRKWFDGLNLAYIQNFSKFWRKGIKKGLMMNDWKQEFRGPWDAHLSIPPALLPLPHPLESPSRPETIEV